MTWKKQEEEKLIELFNQGLTYTEISIMMGRTRNMICGKINRIREQNPEKITRQQNPKKSTRLNPEGQTKPSAPSNTKLRLPHDDDEIEFYILQCREKSFPNMPHSWRDIGDSLGMDWQKVRDTYHAIDAEHVKHEAL